MGKIMKRKLILMFMIALTMGMIGCSSEQKKDEISVENDSPKETVQEEVADVKTVDAKTTETEAKVTESSKSEITEETKKTTSEAEEIPLEEIPVEEIPAGDPIAGIIEKYEENILTLRTPEDDMLYYFFMENTPILEGYSTESAHEAKGGSTIAVGDKVEISYRGTLDDEEHPTQAMKIVIITGE
jgi:outer membrane murein-binding lipoprotein Lpp